MSNQSREQAQNFGKALSNISRQIILAHLFGGPSTGVQIIEATNLSQSLVSQQLKILKNCKLVIDTKKGQETIYEINVESFELFTQTLSEEIAEYKNNTLPNYQKIIK
jgi:DNA-binding transcriptional ArsR family regulator